MPCESPFAVTVNLQNFDGFLRCNTELDDNNVHMTFNIKIADSHSRLIFAAGQVLPVNIKPKKRLNFLMKHKLFNGLLIGIKVRLALTPIKVFPLVM
jgi:hypothetical protein